MVTFLTTFLILFMLVHSDDVDVLCTTTFCEDYDCSNANNNVPENCRIQNSTHSGIFLPFPGSCNCCDYCLRNLDEDDMCSVGEAGQPATSTVCGNLLHCVAINTDSDQGTCEKISDMDCAKDQFQFDDNVENGNVGHLEVREICDRRGLYGHYKCIPGEICYCRNENNERIFGEIPFSSIADHILNCACSSGYEKTSVFLGRNLHVGEYLRCQPNGDYDPIQCIEDQCFCVDASDGAPTYLDASLVNITEISNETLACFNHNMHTEGEYYRPCELEYLKTMEIIKDFEDDDHVVIGTSFPSCQLDGFYAAVQNDETDYYCSDNNGNVLEDFTIPKEDNKNNDMNCYCARARNLVNGEKPECLKNGNYKPIQCRRGFCRCVDKNGNQIEKEVHVTSDTYPDYVEHCNSIA